MSAHVHERPLGGRILTPGFLLLLALVGIWVLLVCARLLWGLNGPFGQSSPLALSSQNDGYAWGIWKPINVVTFTGIAAGAYAVGILTYGFNKGEFHPLVRSAVMAGAMGYTLAGTSVLIDLGRYWNLWVLFWPPNAASSGWRARGRLGTLIRIFPLNGSPPAGVAILRSLLPTITPVTPLTLTGL